MEKIERKNNFRIEYTKGDTYALKLVFKNVTSDLTSAVFSVKENADDETALIEKTIGSGLSKLEENFYKNELVYKLQLQAEDSQNLQADHLYLYDLKIAVGNVIKTVIKGNFVVTYNVTSSERIYTALADIEVDDVIEADIETTPATEGIEYEQDPVAMAKIGDITNLNTTAKNTIVDAVNEVNTKATASAEEITKIENGTVTVPKATNADEADYATNAGHSTSADSATNSTNTTNVQNVDLSSSSTAVFGNYTVRKEILRWSGTQTFTVNNNTVELYVGTENIQGRTFRLCFKLYGGNSSERSIEFTVTKTDTTNRPLFESPRFTPISLIINQLDPYAVNTSLYIHCRSYYRTSFDGNSTDMDSDIVITKLYEII